MNESRSSVDPLVTIVTPVFNGEPYLRACIESVMAQTYENWEYIILNNCSTDNSLEIATEYARRDSRIRVENGTQFLPSIDNHNTAIAKLAPESQYCKPLMADDWLYPECVETLVTAARRSPEVGLICCYATDGVDLLWGGLPFSGVSADPISYLTGDAVCRETLLGGPYLFGTPTSCLIRSDLVRKRTPFYNPDNLHADHESCYDVLTESNFAFVHRILVFNRVHKDSQSTGAWASESIELGDLTVLVRYGRRFLTKEQYDYRYKERFRAYYRILARRALARWGRSNWDLHRKRLAQLGHPFSRIKLLGGILSIGWSFLTRPARLMFGANR